MKPDEFERMRALQWSHWWFRGRRNLLRALLGDSPGHMLILDAGCGTGMAASELRRLGRVVGMDVSPAAFPSLPGSGMETACIGSVERIPFAADTFDLVAALDLLEHVEDDVTAIGELLRVCKAGGRAVIMAPAYPWLWGTHDEALGHYRRYSLPDLRRKLRDAGFVLCKSSYAVTFVLPFGLAFRLTRRLFRTRGGSSDLFPVPRPLNSALAVLMWVESRLLKHANLPFGMSVVAVALKPGEKHNHDLE